MFLCSYENVHFDFLIFLNRYCLLQNIMSYDRGSVCSFFVPFAAIVRREIVREGKCPSGICPSWKFQSGICLVGEKTVGDMSVGELPVGELSVGGSVSRGCVRIP